jgi:DNA repair protein RecO (recombination protein O)
MEWTDEAVILSVRAHGETAALAEVFTRHHGRHAGFVPGGRSRARRPVLQPGNHIDVTWKARLADQLGHFNIELRRAFAATALDRPMALAGLTSLTALLHRLPERDPHPDLYEMTLFVLGFLDDDTVWPALLVRWELALLAELGAGLDLTQCAATGGNDRLIYVSPRTGRAVSASAGEPYKDRLLPLPAFLLGGPGPAPTRADISAGLALTGYFLEARILAPDGAGLPEPRQRLAAMLSGDR